MNKFAQTPEPPYYAVIFSSMRTRVDDAGYGEMSDRMFALAAEQQGYLGVETVCGEEGMGMTISYWESLDAIHNWKKNAEHIIAQKLGKTKWYEKYRLRICLIQKDFGFERS